MVSPKKTLEEATGISLCTSFANSKKFEDLRDSDWDVVVLGAGVAGSSAAIFASRRGLKTLLVESKSFPREKVCGGCLNQRAQASLERLGVKDQVESAGAVSIDSMRLKILRAQAVWRVPKILSVRRSTLDTILVQKAITCGSEFIDGTQGSLLATMSNSKNATRSVRLQNCGESTNIQSKVVLVASGLSRSSIRQEDNWPAKTEDDSRIGVQCLVSERVAPSFSDGRLHMLVGREGYVGICKTDGGLLDVAAAIDPMVIQNQGGIRQVVQRIMVECGFDEIDLPERTQWLATPSLTRSSARVADHRAFLIGDAIGYVEPFTGEGMSWAFASAESVMPIVEEIASHGWRDDMSGRWNEWALRQRKQKQRTCRWIAGQIRWPRGAAWVLWACNWLPPLRASIIRRTSQ